MIDFELLFAEISGLELMLNDRIEAQTQINLLESNLQIANEKVTTLQLANDDLQSRLAECESQLLTSKED